MRYEKKLLKVQKNISVKRIMNNLVNVNGNMNHNQID